jgi:hypothetical protein
MSTNKFRLYLRRHVVQEHHGGELECVLVEGHELSAVAHPVEVTARTGGEVNLLKVREVHIR